MRDGVLVLEVVEDPALRKTRRESDGRDRRAGKDELWATRDQRCIPWTKEEVEATVSETRFVEVRDEKTYVSLM